MRVEDTYSSVSRSHVYFFHTVTTYSVTGIAVNLRGISNTHNNGSTTTTLRKMNRYKRGPEGVKEGVSINV